MDRCDGVVEGEESERESPILLGSNHGPGSDFANRESDEACSVSYRETRCEVGEREIVRDAGHLRRWLSARFSKHERHYPQSKMLSWIFLVNERALTVIL